MKLPQPDRNRAHEPVSVDELAANANMSPSTFRPHFRAITGMNPLQFQKQLRLQEARQWNQLSFIRKFWCPHKSS
jgi:AraC-like DNA-binding protein